MMPAGPDSNLTFKRITLRLLCALSPRISQCCSSGALLCPLHERQHPYSPEEEEKEISENVVIQQRGIHFDNITISEVNDVDLPFFVEENSDGTWSDS